MHPNESVVREMLIAHGNADEARLVDLMTDDVVYHIPGDNALSGTYTGRDEVFRLLARQVNIIGRRFVPEFKEILACDYHVIVLADTVHHSLSYRMANVYHLRHEQISECWIGVTDGMLDFDRFWSA
ncbi:nuclear transport factor 2 family protein [Kribbella sp. NBC_00359]|uniref:nuclear transport factor 2 family protein n=1 Tax=Kribbella sp. NBC_00359 TaxID=2975966 RepID=UPI002E20866D